MAYEFAAAEIPLTEPEVVDDEFVSGLAFARMIDDLMFLAFHTEHVLPPEFQGRRERKIKRRLVMSPAAARRMIRVLQQALDPADQRAPPTLVPGDGHH